MFDNIDYKNLSFERSDGIFVNLIIEMNNPSDLNENFLVLKKQFVTNFKEIDLFYWIDGKRFTLNELKFFSLNNGLCLKIKDKTNTTTLASYGDCAALNRVFGQAWGINFN